LTLSLIAGRLLNTSLTMLRYLAYGPKDFSTSPVLEMSRFNWEFYATLRGSLRPTGTRLKDESFATKPTLWVFPPDRAHGWESLRQVDRVVFHFSSVSDVIREACAKRGFLRMDLEPDDVKMLRELGRTLKEHYRSPTPASLLLFDRALIDLSLLFLRGNDFTEALPLETVAVVRVERVVEWYLSHLHERPTLEALAEVVHISTAHLRRQFQFVYGKSPHLVLRHLRLEKAAQFLSNTGETLDVIASRSGFQSASDLCRVFKRQFKVYPNEWRTRVAGKEPANAKVERLIARIDPARNKLAELRKQGRKAGAAPVRASAG
jgi:AraC family transcriptional regulator